MPRGIPDRYLNQKNRILDHIKIDCGSGCWVWQGATDSGGYGKMRYKSRYSSAHRVSYLLFNGEIQEGKCVLHTCDNRRCCNPDHLLVGTQQDNMDDMVRKGRSCCGEKRDNAVLTDEKVRLIRLRYRSGNVTQKYLGSIFGVTNQTISDVVNSKKWAHVKGRCENV